MTGQSKNMRDDAPFKIDFGTSTIPLNLAFNLLLITDVTLCFTQPAMIERLRKERKVGQRQINDTSRIETYLSSK